MFGVGAETNLGARARADVSATKAMEWRSFAMNPRGNREGRTHGGERGGKRAKVASNGWRVG